MKKTIAAITAACLLLATGCGLHLTGSLEAYGPKETVPAIRVAVGGEEADYGVTLHEWDGFTDAALDYAPWFPGAVQEGVRIPTAPTGTEVTVTFSGEKPQNILVEDYALDEAGEFSWFWGKIASRRYTGTQEMEIPLLECRPEILYGDIGWGTEPFLHGFNMECEWADGNRCTYSFMVRTEQKAVPARKAPPQLRIQCGDAVLEPATLVDRWGGESPRADEAFPELWNLLAQAPIVSLPKDGVLEFSLDGRAPDIGRLSACLLDEESIPEYGEDTLESGNKYLPAFSIEGGQGTLACADLGFPQTPALYGFRLDCTWHSGEPAGRCTYVFVARWDGEPAEAIPD